MFDRIAGVYDVMNTVMTAGLHHRWRSRAVDLARVGPGTARARRRDRHRRSGDRAGLARRRRRGLGLLRGDARAGAREGAGPDLGAGRRDGAALRRRRVRRGDGRLRRAQLRRPRAGPARDGARRQAGRARGDPRDHDAAEAAACRRSSRCGSIASCRCSAASTRRTRTCRARSSASRGPSALAGSLVGGGLPRRRLDPDRRRDHRPAPRDRGVRWRAPRRSPRSSRPGARTSPG